MTATPGFAPETFAMATPSHHGDFERCRLLCESIDRHVSSLSMHYILVDTADAELFAALEAPHRRVMTDTELLPSWLRGHDDPFSRMSRRVWTGAGALLRGIPPLRGWHVQQLRKLALPDVITEDVILYADSDVAFLRPYDLASQILANQVLASQGMTGQTRLYRKPGGIMPGMPHVAWARAAARSLGIKAPDLPANDYITALVTWRRDNAVGLLRHLENQSGKHWVAAVAQRRGFSEWLLYGMYCDNVLGNASRHVHDEHSLAYMVWFEKDVPANGLGDLRLLLEPGQVAIGIQSFIGFPVDEIRRYLARGDDAP